MTVFCQVKWLKGTYASCQSPSQLMDSKTPENKNLFDLEPVTLEGGP